MTCTRRTWIRAIAGAGVMWTAKASSAMPDVTHPRATSGDTAVEPDWDVRVDISVGHKDADIVGTTDKALQAAVDYVYRLGGGTVKVLPGTYRMRNSLFLRTGVRLLGGGVETILIKEPSMETTLSADSDWYDQEITLDDASGFEVGDGICLRSKNAHHGGMMVLKRTLVARSGNRFKIDKALRENFWTSESPTVSSLFPVVTAEEGATDMEIADIAIDGNKANNAHLDGNYGGCIWFQDNSRILMRNVEARNNNGDGISWQICHDVAVENCRSLNNADLGLHPGSGSQRPIMRSNHIEGNTIGIFFCWGVKYGLAEKNIVRENKTGVSIGHRDNFNWVVRNIVERSGEVGLLFRPERGEGFTAEGNRIELNRIADSGGEAAAAVDIQGVTAGNLLAKNEIVESRAPAQRVAIRIGKEAGDNTLQENTIAGFSKDIEDLRAV
ncbi:MAG: hypothetical protein AMXMBFR84_08150 [Candidatus Hydrogenedentota bacterium]